MEKCQKDTVYTTSYQVIQMPEEKAMEFSKPLLPQRTYYTKDWTFNKPLLTRVPIEYAPGIHREMKVVDREIEKLINFNKY